MRSGIKGRTRVRRKAGSGRKSRNLRRDHLRPPTSSITVKRPVSAQRVPTCPTHADAPVPQQITAIGDDGAHHTCTHGLKALRRMGFLPWPVERKPATRQAWRGIARRGRARQAGRGTAWPGRARKCRRGRAWRGRAWRGVARQGRHNTPIYPGTTTGRAGANARTSPEELPSTRRKQIPRRSTGERDSRAGPCGQRTQYRRSKT